MNEDQFNVLSQKVDSLQDSINIINRDLATDRDDLQKMAIRLGAVENVVRELRKSVNNLPQRTQDKVLEVTQPVVDEAHSLRKEIADKKTLILNPTLTFWQKVKSLFKRGGV
jgi:DNA repair ATPase RecN